MRPPFSKLRVKKKARGFSSVYELLPSVCEVRGSFNPVLKETGEREGGRKGRGEGGREGRKDGVKKSNGNCKLLWKLFRHLRAQRPSTIAGWMLGAFQK